MEKVFTPEEMSDALSLYISKRVTKVGLTNSITEWFEQNPIGDEELLDSYLGLYDDYQSLIVGKIRIDKELKAHQYWANWFAQDANGGWAWFDNKPQVREDTFDCPNHGRFESLLPATDWKDTLLQRPQPEVKETVVRRSTHPFARAQQFMPDWTHWVDKNGACFWHE